MNGCDQCEVLTINGVACHETGCPNSWRHPVTGEGYERECNECGCMFTPTVWARPGCVFCGESCYAACYGLALESAGGS